MTEWMRAHSVMTRGRKNGVSFALLAREDLRSQTTEHSESTLMHDSGTK